MFTSLTVQQVCVQPIKNSEHLLTHCPIYSSQGTHFIFAYSNLNYKSEMFKIIQQFNLSLSLNHFLSISQYLLILKQFITCLPCINWERLIDTLPFGQFPMLIQTLINTVHNQTKTKTHRIAKNISFRKKSRLRTILQEFLHSTKSLPPHPHFFQSVLQ